MSDLRVALRLYCVADAGLRAPEALPAIVRSAIAGGVSCVQLRAKALSTAEQVRLARSLRAECRERGIPFIVNDRLDVALAAEADGLHVGHVGQEDLHPADARRILGDGPIIGVSVGSAEEARLAEAAGASYVSAGPMFATATKRDAGPAAGVALLRAVRAATELPLVVIGGVTAERASALFAAGADGVCAGAAIVTAADPAAAARAFPSGRRDKNGGGMFG